MPLALTCVHEHGGAQCYQCGLEVFGGLAPLVLIHGPAQTKDPKSHVLQRRTTEAEVLARILIETHKKRRKGVRTRAQRGRVDVRGKGPDLDVLKEVQGALPATHI